MSAVDLLEPILDDGLKRNNFFNGRLLSAEDLGAEQDANRIQQRHLANATGDGIAWGLGVTILDASSAEPRLRVERGLALNRTGDLLHLADRADVTLVPASTVAEAASGLFVECAKVTASAPISGDKAYVFAISPTSGYTGSALVSDPNASSLGRGSCGSRFTVEGVRFRLIPIALTDLDGIDPAPRARVLDLLTKTADPVSLQLLRNQLAHLCFGTQTLTRFFTDPLALAGTDSVWATWGILDAMRKCGDLTDCDVPLAVVVLTSTGIRSLDMWSARRRLIDADAIDTWRGVAGPRRVAEGEAAFLQFQSQLQSVKAAEAPTSIVASKYFDLLPAAGWLPIGSAGFTPRTFLGPHAPPEPPTPVDAALLRGIIECSWQDEPFALATDPPVPLHVYRVPNESFVVFARSRLANLRVRLTPTPTTADVIQVTSTAKTGAVTQSTTRDGGTVLVPDLAPGAQTVTIAAPNYVAVAAVDTTVIGGRTVDLAITLTPLPKGWVIVTAVDTATGQSIGDKLLGVSAVAPNGTTVSGENQGGGRWKIKDLDDATYSITGNATGYTLISPTPATVTRGVQSTVNLPFRLKPPSKTKPSTCFSFVNAKRPPLGSIRLCMVLTSTEFAEEYYYGAMERKVQALANAEDIFGLASRGDTKGRPKDDRFVSTQGHIVYRNPPWAKMVPLDPQTGKLSDWLTEWAEWLADVLHDGSVAKTLPVVYIDSKYQFPKTEKQVPKTPPGYVAFANFGIPLLIKPESGTTKAPVEIEKAATPGISKTMAKKFYDAKLPYIDDIAWSWGELVFDITGYPPDTPGYMMIDAAKQVTKINADRSYLDGVDASVNEKLVALDLTDDVALANADLAILGAALGSNTLALGLITNARQIVPLDAWSLETSSLTDNQVAHFNERGIDSKGSVARQAETTSGKAVIADLLGMAAAPQAELDLAVNALATDATMAMTLNSVAGVAEVSVAAWATVDQTTARNLTAGGYNSVDDVAKETPEGLSKNANIPLDLATTLVTEANAQSRDAQAVSKIPGLSAEERTNLNSVLGGKATVGAVLKLTPAQLAGAFNGNVARAQAVVQGFNAGLAKAGMDKGAVGR